MVWNISNFKGKVTSVLIIYWNSSLKSFAKFYFNIFLKSKMDFVSLDNISRFDQLSIKCSVNSQKIKTISMIYVPK